jgi:hypothetical protein
VFKWFTSYTINYISTQYDETSPFIFPSFHPSSHHSLHPSPSKIALFIEKCPYLSPWLLYFTILIHPWKAVKGESFTPKSRWIGQYQCKWNERRQNKHKHVSELNGTCFDHQRNTFQSPTKHVLIANETCFDPSPIAWQNHKKSELISNLPPRQLVGKTRWVFRQPQGLSTEWAHMNDYSNWMACLCIGPIRPTEDPAGLPYKLSRRSVEENWRGEGLDKTDTWV